MTIFFRAILIGIGLLLSIFIINFFLFNSPVVQLSPLLDDSPIDKQAVAQRLSRSIQFKTVSSTPLEPSAKQAFIRFHQFLKKSYPLIHTNLQLTKVGELSLLYRWRSENPDAKPLLFLSHQDVVPVDTESLPQWQHPPFSGAIKDNHIWGRGAIDIKSGLMGVMEAIEGLLAKGFIPQQDIYLAFGHDEEIGGSEGAYEIAKGLKKEKLQFQFILDEGGSILEPGAIPGIAQPVALIGIAEKGYVSLKLTAGAAGGHSSMPPQHTALGIIAKAIVALEENPFPPNLQYSRKLFNTVGPAMGVRERFIMANMWLTEDLLDIILSANKTTNATIRTTTAVTMAQGSNKDNILPSKASAIINFRIMPGDSIQSVIDTVRNIIDNEHINIAIVGKANEPSTVSVSDNSQFEAIKSAIYRVSQDDQLIVAPYLVVGGTDAKHYSGLSDSIYRFAYNRFTAHTLQHMHGVNEQINIDHYLNLIRFYRELIVDK